MDGLDLSNICAGSVPEVFERAVRELSKNLKDPNTEAEAKRKIVLEFSFKGYADRSGMEVSFQCRTTSAPIRPVRGTIYVSQVAGGEVAAYPKDPRQDVLFTSEAVNRA